jgi:hypothetical protein
METVFHKVDAEESLSLTKLFFSFEVNLIDSTHNLLGSDNLTKAIWATLMLAPQHRPEYQWLVEQLGPCALSEKTGLRTYDFYPYRNWTVISHTYYFRDEKDAALFKLFWLT